MDYESLWSEYGKKLNVILNFFKSLKQVRRRIREMNWRKTNWSYMPAGFFYALL